MISMPTIIGTLRQMARRWAADILHGHGTVEECVAELERFIQHLDEQD